MITEVVSSSSEEEESVNEEDALQGLLFDERTANKMKIDYLKQKHAAQVEKTKDFKKRWKISEKCLKKELSYHKVLQDEIQRERNNVKTVIEKMREMEEALGERVAELEAELAAKAQELVKLGDTLETHQILQLEAMHKGQKDLAVVPALQREVKDLREVGRRQREVVEAVQRENRVLQRALGAASRVARTGEETLAAYREEASAGLHREVLELRKEIARKNDQIAKWQHKYELAVNKHDEMRKVIFQNGLNPEYTGHQAKLGLGCHTRRNGTNTTGNTFANTECNNSSNHLSLADAVGRHNASMDQSSSSATFFSGKNKKLGIDYGQTRQTLLQRPTLQAHRRHGKSADQQHFSLLPSLQHQQEGSLNSSKALGLPTTIGSSRQQKIQGKEARRHRQKGQKMQSGGVDCTMRFNSTRLDTLVKKNEETLLQKHQHQSNTQHATRISSSQSSGPYSSTPLHKHQLW